MRRKWIKRMTAAALSLVMAISAPLAGMASTGPAATTQEGKDREALALEMERESIVLAQNDSKILPLDQNKTVAVFGRGQINPTKGGNGSGAANGNYTTNFLDGMDRLGVKAYDELRKFMRER